MKKYPIANIMHHTLRLWFALSLAALLNGPLLADDSDSVHFAREVLPILSNKCFVCHGPDTQDADQLRLDSYENATTDRGGYRAIDPSTPSSSAILERIFSSDSPMPPADAERQLTDAERAKLKQWVLDGGKYIRHWAFVTPTRTTPPRYRQSTHENPIDLFIRDGLRNAGTDFAAEADARTLARRVALTVTGLPPEPAELQQFLTDRQPNAYERYVDRMLSKPQFGEHQARYWLDAVRYGDTHGLHLDNRRGIYPYRDWVIRAMNDNLPVDQFITWQLAGDLLPSPTLDQLVATGFVRMNPSTSEGGALPEEFQAKNNFDRTENLGSALLGMTLTCARCHTHKYDPISQTEYYQLLAFFNSTAEPSMDGNKYEYGPTAKVPRDIGTWQQWQQLVGQRDAASLADGRRSAAGAPNNGNAHGEQSAEQLANRIAEIEKTFTTTLVAKELDTPRPTHLLRRGEYNLPVGEPLQPGVLSAMSPFPPDAPRNRLGLAQWLVADDHPVVTRVLVNRMWQQVFGAGLVRTPEDFGLQGQQPTHPELLDWLAVELRESGWDRKQMLRLLLTSRTFKQRSVWRQGLDDPENRLWARGPRYRLDAEVIRDIGLWASGLLDSHMGGEGVKPYQPSGMWLAMAHPASNTKKYERDTDGRIYRRSIYVYWKRTCPHPMMTLFDAPDRESSCVARSRTNTSLQSLALFNETMRVEMARVMADRLLVDVPTDSERIGRMFELVAGRSPSDAERVAMERLLAVQRERYGQHIDDAEALLSVGDAKRNERLDVVDQAAWSQVVATFLASDIALLMY
ncbi:MAG: PSD1 and planctomycete cytochrome C domain-containing protein [Pirellulaceae bacterium]|nr:PSD1 domain-containing protein [Planctomycetales bacterium]